MVDATDKLVNLVPVAISAGIVKKVLENRPRRKKERRNNYPFKKKMW